MNKYEKRVLSASKKWWKSHRPLSFTTKNHLENPNVNTCTDTEKLLSTAVANYIMKVKQK